MKRSIVRMVGVLCVVHSSLIAGVVGQTVNPKTDAKDTVEGIVVEAESGAPLPGAQVLLVELGRVVLTDSQGHFEFSGIAAADQTLGVHLSGYSSYHQKLGKRQGLTIELQVAHFEDEITVTGSPFAVNPLEVSQQVDVVSGDGAKREGTASLGEALQGVAGVENISTGAALGTPVVRGLSENRVRILNDGIGLNHQQFSWRHSPNVEAGLARNIEVVRGPASVLYGPDAMGGVINVIQAPLLVTQPGESILRGELAAGWGSNADEFTGRAQAEGSFGSLGWNLGLVRRVSGDFETPDGPLENTDFEQTNGNATVGFSGTWGTGRVRWNHWELDTGFYRPTDFRLTLDDDLFSADAYLPTSIGDIEILLGRQTNIRKAFPVQLGGTPAVDLRLVTETLRVGLHHRPVGVFRGRLAVESLVMENTPRALGKLVPAYTSDGLALMLFEEGRFFPSEDQASDHLILAFGARWDGSKLRVPAEAVDDFPDGFKQDYSAVTGSLGAVWRVTEVVSLAANIGRGWRPPNAFELFADGIHNGVAAVQVGNPDLIEESNFNREISFRLANKALRGSMTAYRTDFDDFIYIGDTGESLGDLPIFEYRQADAVIEGFEVTLDGLLGSGFRLGGTYAWIETENLETGTRLPQQPANRWTVRACAETSALGPLEVPFVGLEARFVDAQDVSGPDEPFGIATDSNTVVDLRAGFEVLAGSVTWGLDLTVRNLLNEAYTDFLYSYKAVAQNPSRDVRLVGRVEF